jgi:flavin-dependent dehydrogenase
MLDVDVAILGAGPAGATAALNLAPHWRVAVVDRHAVPKARIGESLPPAAKRLLSDMGLWAEFERQGHAPCHGNRATWNGITAEHDFLRDPDGHGWHLDRSRFEMLLRDEAQRRGAKFLTPAGVRGVASAPHGWEVAIAQERKGPFALRAKVLIDAGGRAAMLARKLGARRESRDKLVCAWVSGKDLVDTGDAMSHIEADEQGWWYSAALPSGRRVVAFHTDADLPAARHLQDPAWFAASGQRMKGLSDRLRESGFVADMQPATTAAHSATLTPAAGEGWFAVGDAAISFDPLSSQGLFNALYTGLAAAEATDRALQGDTSAGEGYRIEVGSIGAAYERHLHYCYAQEQRWRQSVFWARRA